MQTLIANSKSMYLISDMMKKFHEINIWNDYNLSYDKITPNIIYTMAVELGDQIMTRYEMSNKEGVL